MWKELKRIIKSNGAILLFGSEPFSSYLRMSNIKDYKYDWIWHKSKKTGFFDCKKRPLNDHEKISVFYQYQCIYNPQMIKAKTIYKRGFVKRKKSDCYGKEKNFIQTDIGKRYPKRIIKFDNANTTGIMHPTQKPVPLLQYLIKTYTNPGATVLDFCMGSGSTGCAAADLNRNFVGIEQERKYFDIAKRRITEANQKLF